MGAAWNGDTRSSGEAYLSYAFASAGNYYVAVSNDANSFYSIITGQGDEVGSEGTYQLVVSVAPADTNDQIEEAKAVAVGSSTTGTISSSIDVSMYAFKVTAGQEIGFDVDKTAGSNFDSFLRLFNSDGETLEASDNAAAPGEAASTDSYIRYRFASAGTFYVGVFDTTGKQLAARAAGLRFVVPSAGRFYVGVSSDANRSYSAAKGNHDTAGQTTAYSLAVFGGDSDDSLPEASTVRIGTTKTDAISTLIDVDMFKFTAQKGQRLGIDIDRAAGTLLDTYIRLFDASGAEIAVNVNFAGPGEPIGRDSYLEILFVETGTYYVSVSSVPNTSFDPATGSADVIGTAAGGYSIRIAAA